MKDNKPIKRTWLLSAACIILTTITVVLVALAAVLRTAELWYIAGGFVILDLGTAWAISKSIKR